jgi:hypothetical protein
MNNGLFDCYGLCAVDVSDFDDVPDSVDVFSCWKRESKLTSGKVHSNDSIATTVTGKRESPFTDDRPGQSWFEVVMKPQLLFR